MAAEDYQSMFSHIRYMLETQVSSDNYEKTEALRQLDEIEQEFEYLLASNETEVEELYEEGW